MNMMVDPLYLESTLSMDTSSLAIIPFLPLLIPFRMIFHHPGERFWDVAGLLLAHVGFNLEDAFYLASLATNFLLSFFLDMAGMIFSYHVDTLVLGTLVATILFSSKFHPL